MMFFKDKCLETEDQWLRMKGGMTVVGKQEGISMDGAIFRYPECGSIYMKLFMCLN